MDRYIIIIDQFGVDPFMERLNTLGYLLLYLSSTVVTGLIRTYLT